MTEAAPAGGFSRLARDSALFAVGSALGKVLAIVLVPILTRSLSPEEFGRVDLLSTIQSAAASLLVLGLDLASTRLFADLDDRDRSRLFTTWLAMTALVAVPVAAGFLLAARPLARAMFDSGDYGTAVALTGLAILSSGVQVVALTALRNHGRPVAYAVASGGTLLTNAVLVIALVPARPTATAVLAAMAGSMTIGAFATLAIARPHLRGRPSRPIARRLLVLGLPAAPAVAATWIAEVANRTILLKRADAEQVAHFSLATRFSSVVVLVVLGFQMAWQPTAFAMGQGPTALRRIADDGRRILTGVAVVVVLVAAASPEAIAVLGGAQYRDAVRAVGLALVFGIMYGAYHAATMPSAISRQMRDIGLSAVVAASVGVGLNGWWSTWGAAGTGAAVAVGQTVGVVVAVALARHRAPVPYRWLRLTLVAAAGSGAAIGCTWPTDGAPLVVRVAIAAGFLVLLWVEGSLRDLVLAVRERSTSNQPSVS